MWEANSVIHTGVLRTSGDWPRRENSNCKQSVQLEDITHEGPHTRVHATAGAKGTR